MMDGAYITDLTHFLDAKGEIPKTIPKEARAFACFLALVADGVTSRFPNTVRGTATGIRCRAEGCKGEIIGALDSLEDPVHWYCLDCGQHGVIRNWRGTKWDRTGRQQRPSHGLPSLAAEGRAEAPDTP